MSCLNKYINSNKTLLVILSKRHFSTADSKSDFDSAIVKVMTKMWLYDIKCLLFIAAVPNIYIERS